MDETRRAVLAALERGPVTGPELAADLGISRTAVWKHVEALRATGFEIDGTPVGYEVTAVPDYGGLPVAFGLDAPFEIEYHETIDSTNDRARALAGAGKVDRVVLADEQTGGRGRLGRAWTSPAGGIWVSVVLRPDLAPSRVPVLTLAAAVAVAEAARETGVEALIKWPNDVVVGEHKLAGILTEMSGEVDRVDWVVIGIGLNANVPTAALPPEATSLQAEGHPVERREVVQSILETLDALRTDPAAIRRRWRALAVTLGRRVRIETTDAIVTGTATDVTDAGSLVLDTRDGPMTVAGGDCEHLGPA